MSIRQAAMELDIPYENAKLINRVYKNEGRHRRLRRMQGGDKIAPATSEVPQSNQSLAVKVANVQSTSYFQNNIKRSER